MPVRKGLSSQELTENEGMLLALIVRQQPVTAYQLYKIYEKSPVTSINASKGQLYPAIRRLKSRGFLSSKKVLGDGRNAEELSATSSGRAAARQWAKNIDPSHIVLDDPIRTRLFSLDLLTREEQLEWAAKAKALVKERRSAVDEYDRSISVPFQHFAHRSTAEVLDSKSEWLDDLMAEIASRGGRRRGG